MSARLVYRIAAVLLVLFAVGHTLGFSQADPKWGLDALLAANKKKAPAKKAAAKKAPAKRAAAKK